jgi:hypothetical protein
MGPQLLGGGVQSILGKLGLPNAGQIPAAPPPNSGGAPVDSAGAPTSFIRTGGGRRIPLSAPMQGTTGPLGLTAAGMSFDDLPSDPSMYGGAAAGGMTVAGVPDFPGGMGMPIPSGSVGGIVSRAASARSIGVLAGRALALTRMLGPVGAAAALGIGAIDLAKLVFHALMHKKRRRHRGISARDMRISRRTIGKIERAHHQLQHAFGHATHRARARPGGFRGRGQVIEMIKQ